MNEVSDIVNGEKPTQRADCQESGRIKDREA